MRHNYKDTWVNVAYEKDGVMHYGKVRGYHQETYLEQLERMVKEGLMTPDQAEYALRLEMSKTHVQKHNDLLISELQSRARYLAK